MLKKMLNRKGFTLIELMIVVAIIGILAAIAIPNFLRYQAKSKQSEAKLLLSGFWTAETAYFAEQNTFSKNFTLIGFTPAGAPKSYNTGALRGAGFPEPVTATLVTFCGEERGNIDSEATGVDQWYVNQLSRAPIVKNDDVSVDTGLTAKCV